MPSSVPPDLRPKRPAPVVVRKPPVPVKKTTVKPQPKTGMAGLYGGLGPVKYVDQMYAPQTQLLQQQQEARSKQLSSMVSQFLASLSGVSNELAPYTAAANQQNSDARNAAASLAAANPNAVTQNDLAAINAPESQRAQVTGQNQTAFNGNAALLQYAGGAIPADVFRQDAAGRAAYLAALPNIGAAIGTQGINQLSNLASRENLQLAGLKSDALQKARSDLSTFSAQKQSNAISQAAVVGNLLGYIPAGLLGNKKPIGTLAGTRADISQQNANTSQQRANTADTYAQKNYGLRLREVQLAEKKAKATRKAGGLSASKLADLRKQAASRLQTAYHGVPAQYQIGPDGSRGLVAGTGPDSVKTYQDAIKELMLAYPALGPKTIINMANRLYRPGEGGRPAYSAKDTRKMKQINATLFPNLFTQTTNGGR